MFQPSSSKSPFSKPGKGTTSFSNPFGVSSTSSNYTFGSRAKQRESGFGFGASTSKTSSPPSTTFHNGFGSTKAKSKGSTKARPKTSSIFSDGKTSEGAFTMFSSPAPKPNPFKGFGATNPFTSTPSPFGAPVATKESGQVFGKSTPFTSGARDKPNKPYTSFDAPPPPPTNPFGNGISFGGFRSKTKVKPNPFALETNHGGRNRSNCDTASHPFGLMKSEGMGLSKEITKASSTRYGFDSMQHGKAANTFRTNSNSNLISLQNSNSPCFNHPTPTQKVTFEVRMNDSSKKYVARDKKDKKRRQARRKANKIALGQKMSREKFVRNKQIEQISGKFGGPDAINGGSGLFETRATTSQVETRSVPTDESTPADVLGSSLFSSTKQEGWNFDFGATNSGNAVFGKYTNMKASNCTEDTGKIFDKAPTPASKASTKGIFDYTVVTKPDLVSPAVNGPTCQTNTVELPNATTVLAQKLAAVESQRRELTRTSASSPEQLLSHKLAILEGKTMELKGFGAHETQQSEEVSRQRKEVAVLEAWRDKKAAKSSLVPTNTTKCTRDMSSTYNLNIESLNLSVYKALPVSTTKIRPRGFGITKEKTTDPSIRNKVVSSSTVDTSTKKHLVIKPEALIPMTKRLLLTDDDTPEKEEKKAMNNGEVRSTKVADSYIENKNPGQTEDSQITKLSRDGTKDLMRQNDNSADISVDEKIMIKKQNSLHMDGMKEERTKPNQANLEKRKEKGQDKVSSIPTTQTNLLPKLSKKGYNISPSLDELSKMNEAELATVSNFSIHRVGYGSVAWDGAVDIREVDLDHVLSIESKDIRVYNDDKEHKPPIGSKLNRSAVITMSNMFPTNGKESSIEMKKFERRIVKATKKMGAELIRYDIDSGEWEFRVQHF